MPGTDDEEPLLVRMSDPQSPFMQGLRMFRSRTRKLVPLLCSCGWAVRWLSASMRACDSVGCGPAPGLPCHVESRLAALPALSRSLVPCVQCTAVCRATGLCPSRPPAVCRATRSKVRFTAWHPSLPAPPIAEPRSPSDTVRSLCEQRCLRRSCHGCRSTLQSLIRLRTLLSTARWCFFSLNCSCPRLVLHMF